MLAICLACALSITGLRAQSYTPVPYNFPAAPESVPLTYTDPGNSSISYNEHVTAMAANGYGLWLAGFDGDGGQAWKLSGNGLFWANSTPNSLEPSGTLSYGIDASPGDRKVATNLRGSVRYVSLNADNDKFVVYGLNDAQVGGPAASQQISVKIPYSGMANIFTDPASVISTTYPNEYHYPDVPTKITGEYCDNNENATPINEDDDWDIAVDGHFLYIVWTHSHSGTCYPVTPIDEIFLTCTDLATGAVQAGFPVIFHPRDLALQCAADQVGVGTEPTVACDVRNNNTPDANGFYHPSCDIAFIDGSGGVWHYWVNSSTLNNPTICSQQGDKYSFSEKFGYEQLPTSFSGPYNSPPITSVTYAPTPAYGGAFRARIMVASAAGLTSNVLGCYVLTPDGPGYNLLFFNKASGGWKGYFVDGLSTATDFSLDPPPVGAGATYEVVNAPTNQIVCFANPYDGEADGNYDEFHCVYTVSTYNAHNVELNDGLMIVSGADNGVPWPASPPTLENTRTVVNLGGTLDYCAAANEAGIHIRWDDGTNEYYMRDRRSYDEPIEENTIMSFDNYIADGSSTGANHGGTVGAETQPGEDVLLWSQPGIPDTNYGCQINFGNAGSLPVTNANGAGLTIGNTSAANISNPASKLYWLPSNVCFFQSPPLTANRNFIQIDRSGSCDYYGGSFDGGGDFNLNGNSDGSYPALINIMPGCNFHMFNSSDPGFPRFLSSYGTVKSENGTGADHNPQDNGYVTMDGAIQFDHTTIACSALIQAPLFNVVTLNGIANCPFSTSITYSGIVDNGTGGAAQFFVHDPLTAVTFDNTTMNAVELYVFYGLHGSDSPVPSRPLTVTYGTFENIPQQGISLQRDFSTTDQNADFAPITLDGNTFENFLGPNSDGILLQDFIPNVPGDLAVDGTQLEIESNTFTTASTFGTVHPGDTSHVEAAIHLVNSSAVVDDNTFGTTSSVRSNGTFTYAYGILMDANVQGYDYTKIANSLLCHNTISYVGYGFVTDNGVTHEAGGGISTRFWNGYEKKDEVSNSSQGSIVNEYDAGKYLLGYYHDNNGPGINITSATNTPNVEMRGLIHPDNVGDMAGFNRITGNNSDHNSASGEVVISGDVAYTLGVNLLIGNETGTGSSSVTYGENAFVENTNGTDVLFYTPSANKGYAIIGVNTHEFDDDYYEVAGAPFQPTTFPSEYASPFLNYFFDGYTSPVWLGIPPSPLPTVYCYGGSERTKQSGSSTLSSASLDTTDECLKLLNYIGEDITSQQEYDSSKELVTLCYNTPIPNRPNNYGMGIAGFPYASAGNDNRSNDLNRFVEFREWLKSVLYLRTDTSWYCTDVSFIMHTLASYYDSIHGRYPNAVEAVKRYILEHQRCDSLSSAEIANGSKYPGALYAIWRDTVKDSILYDTIKNSLGEDTIIDSILYPDTTVPSIDSIGLSILRGLPAAVHSVQLASGTTEISGLSATENPFTNATEIKFDLAQYGLVTFQLFDLLGNAVTTNGIGQVLYPGEHSFEVDGSKLSPGTYFARVAFHDGDVESIMVIKK